MQRLKTMLNSIDHKGYPAYKGLKGSYDFGDYRLGIDKVQGDPFASPSRAKYFFDLYRRSCITPAVMRILTPKSYRELQTSQTISVTSESRWRKKGILLLLPMDQCCRARMEYPNVQ